MDLTPYVEAFRQQLLLAAEAGGDDAVRVAERLTVAVDSVARLVLLEALSAAANEITADLAPGSIDVRLRGRDPEFVVVAPPEVEPSADQPTARPTTTTPGPAAETDATATSRITLRLSEQIKARIEEAAASEGLSVNSWLLRSASAALDPARGAPPPTRGGAPSGQRFVGWAR